MSTSIMIPVYELQRIKELSQKYKVERQTEEQLRSRCVFGINMYNINKTNANIAFYFSRKFMVVFFILRHNYRIYPK